MEHVLGLTNRYQIVHILFLYAIEKTLEVPSEIF